MLRLSARNQFAHTITEIRKGVTIRYIKIELAPGVIFTSAITNESAEELARMLDAMAADRAFNRAICR